MYYSLLYDLGPGEVSLWAMRHTPPGPGPMGLISQAQSR
jgi:hypothetical protein